MGIFGTLRDLCFGRPDLEIALPSDPHRSRARSARSSRAASKGQRRCLIEELEPRRLFAADVAPHVILGSTYYESDSGDDSIPNTIQITFNGGAPGTTLNHLTINGDKRLDGLTDGDIFFDTADGGLGAFKSNPLQIVSSDGFTVSAAHVTDGGTQITFDFTGFHSGDKLVFSIDADEAQFVDGTSVDTNSTVEGGEFQRSILVGDFSATGYVDLQLQALYWDAFDQNFTDAEQSAGSILDLPNDAYTPTHDYSDRTAGAVAEAAQIPLASISGWVYHDRNDDGVFQSGSEEGIGGVTVELLDANGNGTGITTTTSTDPANFGHYEFDNLVPGAYGVREVQPNGWLDGKDAAGDHGGTAADESLGRVDKITGATLNYGDHALNYNFGELLPGSISGLVEAHHDANCNFTDPPEVTLQGVQIDLLDANGNFIRSTLTAADGTYQFDNLAPGTYQVFEHQPADFYEGMEQVGTAGGTLIAQDHFAGIHIGSDIHGLNYDFCEHIGVNLSGYVYHDRNDDGIFDTPAEEGIPGVTLELFDGNGHDTGKRATTDAAGHYVFTNLAAGAYAVVEIQPAGWLDGKDTPGNSGGVADFSPPGDRISQILLNWGIDGVQYNFGELLPGSISGHVQICDENLTGDGPNIPLAGAKVDLLDANGNFLASTTTNDKGEYAFTNLRPGRYQVLEHTPDNYFDDEAHIGSGDGVIVDPSDIKNIDVGSDQNLVNYDFCEVPPGSISGQVQAHFYGDCNFQSPEQVIAGVTIQLLDSSGHVIATTTTDANGRYQFDKLHQGVYSVHEIQPAGYYDDDQNVGSAGGTDDGIDSILNIHLPAGINATDYDFCEHIGVMLTGYVYHDRNDDGVYDRSTEQPIAGVTLKLIDSEGHDTGLRAVTDSTGFYKFNNLAAGSYTVMEIQPSGWIDGKDTPGNSGGVALPPPGDMISQITLEWGVNAVEYDFGELLPGSLSGHVQICDVAITDGEGNFPLAGVTVNLLNSQGTIIESAVTNQQGEYSFDNLRPGAYSVSEVQPSTYFDDEDHIGSGDGVIVNSNLISTIHVGSGQDLVNYDFCELPPAQLSGYVYIDGAPIVFDDTPPTTDEIAALRNGQHTPDDTPLAGVTLELRDGSTGAPILIGNALPGSYSGAASDPIRVTTDANGYYHFGGLAAGFYAVTEVQPSGVIDNLDTPGTTGGFAANPVGLWSSPVSSPDPLDQATIDQFRNSYGTDAIVRIPLVAGQHSEENDFSEVVLQPTPPHKIPPPPPPPPQSPPPTPPVFPPLAIDNPPFLWAPPVPNITPPETYGGHDDAHGYTWHLSVVNAGWPRNILPGDAAAYQVTAADFQSATWQNIALDRATWTLATLDGDRIVTYREAVFGNEKSIPITGDFNGDGATDIGVYIDGQWFLDLNGNGKWDNGDLWAQLGTRDDLPVTGDWDADGKTDIGIYGPAWPRDPWAISVEPGLPDADNAPTHHSPRKHKNMPPKPEHATSGRRMLRRTANGKSRADLIDHVFHYGEPGDVPLAGDWNGDGIRTIGVFHDGEWYLDLDGDGKFTEKDAHFVFGQKGDIPVVGNFNGDGIDVVGVYRNGKWIIDSNNNHHIDAHDKVFELGGPGDKPVVGDWNDTGRDQPGVFHPGAPTARQAANPPTKRAG